MANLDKRTKKTIKGLKQDNDQLGKEVDNLKLELDAKSKAVDDAAAEKNKLEDESRKLKDHNSQLQFYLSQANRDKDGALKAAKEEVEMSDAEVVEEMKNRHADELIESHEEGWNSVIDACGSQKA